MPTFRHIPILFLICSVCSATKPTKSGQGLRDAGASSIEELKPVFEMQMEKDQEPIKVFESNYESHLQKLADQAQKAGQLDLLVIVKAEIESFRKGGHQDSSTYPNLKKLQSIYLKERPRIAAFAASKQMETMRFYLSKLADLKKVLTQEGNLDTAIEVKEEQERIHQLIEECKKNAVVSKKKPAEEESGAEAIAKIDAVAGSMERYRKGRRIFTDKPVDIEDVPSEFGGLQFVLTSKNGGSAKILEPGIVFVATAAPSTPNDRKNDLVAAGFKKENIPPFQLYGTHPWDQAQVFSKNVAAGETVSVGKYGIIVGR